VYRGYQYYLDIFTSIIGARSSAPNCSIHIGACMLLHAESALRETMASPRRNRRRAGRLQQHHARSVTGGSRAALQLQQQRARLMMINANNVTANEPSVTQRVIREIHGGGAVVTICCNRRRTRPPHRLPSCVVRSVRRSDSPDTMTGCTSRDVEGRSGR
jgi:hypothetical protein